MSGDDLASSAKRLVKKDITSPFKEDRWIKMDEYFYYKKVLKGAMVEISSCIKSVCSIHTGGTI